MTAATAIYKGMLGMNGMTQSIFSEFGSIPYRKPEFFQTMLVGFIICLALPPTITLQRWVPQARALAGRPRLAAWVNAFQERASMRATPLSGETHD
jgi:alginate O-acetyltransferase complex protein AlgI